VAKKETPLTKETAKIMMQEVIKDAFKELFPVAFKKAFEPYAVAIQGDFNKVHSDIKGLKEDVGELKEDLSDTNNTVNRIELAQKAEIKRANGFSIRLEKHAKRPIKLEHKLA